MKTQRILFAAAWLAVVRMPLSAQPIGQSTAGAWRAETRIQFWRFGNFTQASDARFEEDVNAYGAEVRGAYHPKAVPFDVYGHVNFLHYDTDRDDSVGVRAGMSMDTEVNDFNVYVDHATNRATFDVGDTVSTAAITTLAGQYSRRIGDWEPGVEATHEMQRFNVSSTGQDNDYTGGGASVRYRGFGWKFSPTVGFTTGKRKSDDDVESYDEDAWYVQVAYIPVPRLYLSLQYRDRKRDYSTSDIANRNFGRNDKRPQWSLVSSLRINPRFTGILYYANEDVTSSRAGRSFQDDLVILSLAVKLH
ncbi:MAG TPA: hypothetical protein VJZ00_20860 [Thermoanaerobaculia bacterium]|nr:hypothetical protein [Thermoanaerobaculia bacterium]